MQNKDFTVLLPSYLSVGNLVYIIKGSNKNMLCEVMRLLDRDIIEVRAAGWTTQEDDPVRFEVQRRAVVRVFRAGDNVVVKDGPHKGRVGFVTWAGYDGYWALVITEHDTFTEVWQSQAWTKVELTDFL